MPNLVLIRGRKRMNYNSATMLRYCYCWNCKQYTKTMNPAPICPHCYQPIVTVIYSVVTGKQITGAVDITDYSIGEKE